MHGMPDQHPASLEVTRVRHPLKMRLLQVRRVARLTPDRVRVTLSGDDLAGFTSASFDDHVKVFFPAPGSEMPVVPVLTADGPVFPAGEPRLIARDYTPRRYDPVAQELDIEFVLHDAGPASAWAEQAAEGQYLSIGGPRGSFVVPTGFDWHLLIGDDTALPAIARRLEELPAATQAIALIEVADPLSVLPLTSAARLSTVWCYRHAGRPDPLLNAVRGLELPPGEGYIWAAAESAAIRAIRTHLIHERGIDKARIRAASYWKQGDAAVHETLTD